MILTIDGPAGTGKSTVAQEVAQRLGFDFLDTGAMYRAVALASSRAGIDPADAAAVGRIVSTLRIAFDWSARPPELLLNGERAARLLRDAAMTRGASIVATLGVVRTRLVAEQRRIAAEHGRLVTEGRDQGSVVFPDAELKIYLSATPEERARRRVAQLASRGQPGDYRAVLAEIVERDARDAGRAEAPLRVPDGARQIDTTTLSQAEVIDRIVAYAREAGLC